MSGWIADELPNDDEVWMQTGDAYFTGNDGPVPTIRHPIGFVVGPRKPRVRVKAWTRPIEGNT